MIEVDELTVIHGLERYRRCQDGRVERYTSSSYGDAFADVYDDWYRGVSDIDATVALIDRLASEAGRRSVLELGVGTGRLAVPLAQRGLAVTGIDASEAMLERLRQRDPDGTVTTITGDMVGDVPDGPFGAVLVAYNTLFNLTSAERQSACFAAAARSLTPGGSFVVEAFVPEDPPRQGSHVELRSMSATDVVLSVSTHRPGEQRAEGQFIHLVDGGQVRLRPWSIRYAPPAELDAMADAAGLALASRWEDVTGRPFDPYSPRHVSVYTRRERSVT